MHSSVRGIIKKEDGIILIHRIKRKKDGTYREYYVVPGGKMEKNETEEETVIREVKEEVGIIIKPFKKMFEYNSDYDNSIQKFYLCEYIKGEIGTGNGPELNNKLEDEVFEIVIIKKNEIANINLVPEEIKDIILREEM